MNFFKLKLTVCLCQVGPEPTDMVLLCQHLSAVTEVVTQHLKQVRRRVALFDSDLPASSATSDLPLSCSLMARVAKLLRELAKSALSQLGNNAGKKLIQ